MIRLQNWKATSRCLTQFSLRTILNLFFNPLLSSPEYLTVCYMNLPRDRSDFISMHLPIYIHVYKRSGLYNFDMNRIDQCFAAHIFQSCYEQYCYTLFIFNNIVQCRSQVWTRRAPQHCSLLLNRGLGDFSHVQFTFRISQYIFHKIAWDTKIPTRIYSLRETYTYKC